MSIWQIHLITMRTSSAWDQHVKPMRDTFRRCSRMCLPEARTEQPSFPPKLRPNPATSRPDMTRGVEQNVAKNTLVASNAYFALHLHLVQSRVSFHSALLACILSFSSITLIAVSGYLAFSYHVSPLSTGSTPSCSSRRQVTTRQLPSPGPGQHLRRGRRRRIQESRPVTSEPG